MYFVESSKMLCLDTLIICYVAVSEIYKIKKTIAKGMQAFKLTFHDKLSFKK